jgi:hypothetical protein
MDGAFALMLVAVAMLALGSAMAAYDWSRSKAKRPLFGGHEVVTLYWCAYLCLLVLGITFFAAAMRDWAA